MAQKRRMTAEDLYRLANLLDCAISPDGRHVACTVRRVDPRTEKRYSNLWVVPTAGGRPRQFTDGAWQDASPRWSPDGRQLAFLSNRGVEAQSQVYLLPFDGGEARRLTNLRGDFGALEWSPDGRRLLLQFRKKDAEAVAREADEGKKRLGVVARHVTRVVYKADGAGFLPNERWHVWTADARTGRATQVTSGDVYDETEPCWSPDGGSIVFVSNRTDDPDFHPDHVDLWAVPAGGGALRKIETHVGKKGQPSISPNGRWVAFVGRERRADWWQNDLLWIVPFDGSDKPRSLTGDHDLCVSSSTTEDQGAYGANAPVWSPDGVRIYFQVAHHGSTVLKAVSLADGGLEPVVDERGVVGAYSLDDAGTRLAYIHGDVDDTGQVWVRDLAASRSRKLTSVNQRTLAAMDLGQVEEVWFEGAAGNDLQGWIMKPPGFDPARRYPAIVEVHGGPLTQYGNAFMHEFHFLAAQGYVVAFSNPRGGRGYGQEHAHAIWNNHGTADYDDVMAWTDYVASQPYVDADRIGVTGGSYGGFMVNWIIGHTPRFRAAVSQRSIFNRTSNYGTSDMNWIREEPFGDEPPWENLENYLRQSPMTAIANARTPTLVIHSENDMRCPIEQGEQLFVALKRLGVDTEMVRFPDESHGLSRGGRTDRRIVRLKHILRWFDRYLKE